MGIATNWLMAQLQPLIDRIAAVEQRPALSSTDSATLAQCRALLAEMDGAPEATVNPNGTPSETVMITDVLP